LHDDSAEGLSNSMAVGLTHKRVRIAALDPRKDLEFDQRQFWTMAPDLFVVTPFRIVAPEMRYRLQQPDSPRDA
jgi:hypothetical protein